MRFGAIAVGAALALSACGGSSSSSGASSGATHTKATHTKATHSPGGATLHATHTSLGNVLVDSRGMTVYLLTSDKPNKSLCSSTCLSYWPPVAAPKSGAKLPGVTGKVGSAKATNGTSIATVGGWPLYTYVGDKTPGQVTGEGIATFGGTWWAVSPSGQPVKGKPASSSSGGNGY
jgi:predicted lipoprotein with Yx(FWY)xxD motif